VIMNPTGDIDIDQLIGDIKINKTIKNRFGYTYTKNLFIVHCHDFNRIKNSSLFTLTH
jgi:predicted ATP-dependent serine protease